MGNAGIAEVFIQRTRNHLDGKVQVQREDLLPASSDLSSCIVSNELKFQTVAVINFFSILVAMS